MNVNIKATNIELTNAISNYISKKITSIEKFSKKNGKIFGYVEVGKTTNHHKQGDVFKAEFDITMNSKHYFALSEMGDLYSAIDDAKNELISKISQDKDRKQTLFKRGASSIKKMIKGTSKRNPFTSKY
ncbi:MAG: ribosome-associated translation inhibitor RaiA [Patescibacteria group bacterium]|nr:ribosome-associated translation inhibitor RaiA [Patescibacteria group bacterium]